MGRVWRPQPEPEPIEYAVVVPLCVRCGKRTERAWHVWPLNGPGFHCPPCLEEYKLEHQSVPAVESSKAGIEPAGAEADY